MKVLIIDMDSRLRGNDVKANRDDVEENRNDENNTASLLTSLSLLGLLLVSLLSLKKPTLGGDFKPEFQVFGFLPLLQTQEKPV